MGLGHSNRLGLSNLLIANILLRGGEGIDCTSAVAFGIEVNIDTRGVDMKGVYFFHINVPAREFGLTGDMFSCPILSFCPRYQLLPIPSSTYLHLHLSIPAFVLYSLLLNIHRK